MATVAEEENASEVLSSQCPAEPLIEWLLTNRAPQPGWGTLKPADELEELFLVITLRLCLPLAACPYYH